MCCRSDFGGGCEELVDLAGHRVRTLQRRSVLERDVQEEVALVFLGNETRLDRLARRDRQDAECDKDDGAHDRLRARKPDPLT